MLWVLLNNHGSRLNYACDEIRVVVVLYPGDPRDERAHPYYRNPRRPLSYKDALAIEPAAAVRMIQTCQAIGVLKQPLTCR